MCPSCARRHGADQRFCSDCRMPLVVAGAETLETARDARHERLRKIRPELAEGPLVTVAGARHLAEAELIQGLLLEEGVPSLLRRTAGFDVPDFLAAGPRDVLVPETGATTARELLAGSELAPARVQAPAPEARRAALIAGVVVGGGALAAGVAWALLRLAA